MKKLIVPSIASVILLILFTKLLISNHIGTTSYTTLSATSLFVGLVLYFREEIKEIDLKNMKLILQRAERIKKEINQVALSLAKIISNLSTYSSGSWLNRKKLNDEIEKLLLSLGVSSKEKNNILDLPRTVEKMMKDEKSLTKTDRKKIDEMFKLKESMEKN